MKTLILILNSHSQTLKNMRVKKYRSSTNLVHFSGKFSNIPSNFDLSIFCIGYTRILIPIYRLFGTFSADFCQVFLQNLSQNSEEKQKPNSKSLPNTSFFPNVCRNFAEKMLKVCQVQIICQKNDKYQSFQYIFGKKSAK